MSLILTFVSSRCCLRHTIPKTKQAGFLKEGLALGLGNDRPLLDGQGKDEKAAAEEAEDGADRWSLVSVRGSRQAAAVLPPGQWRAEEGDGSLYLEGRAAKPGQYLR